MAAPLASYSSFKYFVVTAPAPLVAHVEINRPEKLNAFHEPMRLELRRVFTQLSTDPDVRAVVLSGAGDHAFTSGLDLKAASEVLGQQQQQQEGGGGSGGEGGIAGADVARKAAALRRYLVDFQDCLSAVERCEKPVVCVLHGVSFGLAIDLACCADVRLCARDARLAVREVDIGLAADLGSLARLPRLVAGQSWARDVCLTAREFGAAEALQAGLVSRVLATKANAVADATSTAALMARKSPVAVQGTKELLNHARDNPVSESLRYTAAWNSAMLQSNDLTAAFLSGLRGTRPTFEKL